MSERSPQEIWVGKTEFISSPTENEQLAIETCPGYDRALTRAVNDFYEWKKCIDCQLQVRVIPAIRTANVRGKCPKL